MCNLYNVSPKGDLERYLRKAGKQARLPMFGMTTVGPNQDGVFLRPVGKEVVGFVGQWGMIRPGSPERISLKKAKPPEPGKRAKKPEVMLTNNARVETVATRPTFRHAWANGQRCLIPALWLQEPNWETGKNIWWHLYRADADPWMIAGLWSEWTDKETGEVVPNFTMLTVNVNSHPLLSRLHRPDRDPATGEILPPEAQDKRGEAHIEPADWDTWLFGTEQEALRLLVPPPVQMYRPDTAAQTDEILERMRSGTLTPHVPPGAEKLKAKEPTSIPADDSQLDLL